MLQNAYFLAKIGADTAENEQHFAEILPTDALWITLTFASLVVPRRHGVVLAAVPEPGGRRERHAELLEAHQDVPVRSGAAAGRRCVGWQNLCKMLLVFGCIGSDFCNKICVLQHFSKSTRFSS